MPSERRSILYRVLKHEITLGNVSTPREALSQGGFSVLCIAEHRLPFPNGGQSHNITRMSRITCST